MAAGAAGSRALAADAPRIKIRITTTPIDTSAEVLWAYELGLFAKQGLDAEITLMNNGAQELAATTAGAMDIANSNVVSLASAYEHNVPLVAVSSGSVYSSRNVTTGLVVAGNSPIAKATDFEGQTIGVTGLKNIAQVGAQAWLHAGGADLSRVTFIELPVQTMIPAVVSGRVAGAVVVEPFLSNAAAGGARQLAPVFDAIAPAFLIDMWCCTEAWFSANRDTVRRFNAAIFETAKWANRNHAESARLLAKYTKSPIAANVRRADWAENTDVTLAQPLIDAAAKFNAIGGSFPAAKLFR